MVRKILLKNRFAKENIYESANNSKTMNIKSKLILNFCLILLIFSCKKETKEVEPTDSKTDVYEVTTLKSAASGTVKEGPLSEVNVNDIGSMVFDSKGNLYMTDWDSYLVKKLSTNGVVSVLKVAEDANFQSTPDKVTISADNTLLITTLYQPNSVLFYYSKNDEPIKAFANPFKDSNTFGSTSFMYKKKDGKYLVVYDEKLYEFTNENTYVDLKLDVVIEGNQLQSQTSFMNANEELYYVPSSLYDTGGEISDKLKYITKDFTKKSITSAKFLSSNSSDKFTAGDGKLPKAFFGDLDGVCGDNFGNIYTFGGMSFSEPIKIRKLSKDGQLTTIAGGVIGENKDGIGEKAGFQFPRAIATDPSGNIYVSTDIGIRKIVKMK
jgi:hypothetical protein